MLYIPVAKSQIPPSFFTYRNLLEFNNSLDENQNILPSSIGPHHCAKRGCLKKRTLSNTGHRYRELANEVVARRRIVVLHRETQHGNLRAEEDFVERLVPHGIEP